MRLKKGDTVEVSSDEEGFSGAWFPATILRKVGNVKGKTFLVEFRDLMTDYEKSKLKEKVKAHMIRPEPPALNRQCFFLNEEVDAYDQAGWWRGVVYGILRQNKYLVYINQTLEKLEYDITQLRLHQDWTHNKWVNNSEVEFTNQRLAQNCTSDGSMFEKRLKSDPLITALVKAKYRSMEIPQVDGVNDNLDSTVADEGNIEAKDQEQQALNDVASLKVSEDEEPLNDKDDDPDDLDQTSEDPKTDDLVLAQFEKVSRTKNRWKCILKDGVMHLNNKDIVFSKATGEFEF